MSKSVVGKEERIQFGKKRKNEKRIKIVGIENHLVATH